MKGRNTLMTYAKHSAICPVCKGNGYLIKKQNILSVWNFNWKYSKTVDCKMCHNQGEIKYEEPKIVPFSGSPGCPHN